MPHETEKPFKLLAKDAEDLTVFSTFLQDAIIPIATMQFHKNEKHFALLANRFRWELTPHKEYEDVHERLHTRIVFSNVQSVQHIGFHHQKHHTHGLVLLMIKYEKPYISLLFSGQHEVKLKVTKLLGHLQDISEPWPATRKPEHPIAL